MPIYNYTATDATGNRRAGSADAHNQDSALTLLRNQGLYVISLDEKKTSVLDLFSDFRGVPENEVVNFTRQFSTMISAGLPISRALEILGEQTTNGKMKKVLMDILREVEGGSPVSVVMGKYPKIFPRTYQALIKAGESSGKLDEILKKLAENMEKSRELKSKFKAAMVYPIIVFIAMIGVFVLMMVFVIPKLAGLYESMNVELPLITRLMISTSKLFTQKIYIIFGIVIGGFFLIRAFLRSEFGKNSMAFLSFRIPVFGKLNKQTEITQFASTLSLLITSAVPIVESLKIVSEVVGNKYFREAALEAATRVEKGNQLSGYFKSNKIFPPLLGQMAAVGEETGQLDAALLKVADYYGSEVDNAVRGLSAALEPIILVVLGAMVAVLIISIITPIYKITSSI